MIILDFIKLFEISEKKWINRPLGLNTNFFEKIQ